MVRPRYCSSSSLTVPDTSEGPGWTVSVIVTVGAGSGEVVEAGADELDVVGAGVAVSGREPVNSKGEVCPGVAPVATFTLKVPDDVPDESANKAEGEKGSIHYRPQFRTTARARTTKVGTPRANTVSAGPRAGELADRLWWEDIRSVPALSLVM